MSPAHDPRHPAPQSTTAILAARGRPGRGSVRTVMAPAAPAAALFLAAAFGGCRGVDGPPATAECLVQPVGDSVAIEADTGSRWRRGRFRAAAETVVIASRPQPLELHVRWDPRLAPDPTGVVNELCTELAAALTATRQFTVVRFVDPGGIAPELVLGGPAGPPPVDPLVDPPPAVCHVTIRAVSPVPPLWLSAEMELLRPDRPDLAVRMQGTWRPPERARSLVKGPAQRWHLVHQQAQDFDPEVVLIPSSPRYFARYVARDAALSLSDQWRHVIAMSPAGPIMSPAEPISGSSW